MDKQGEAIDGWEALIRGSRKAAISSGSSGLDEILGGGYRAGRLVEIFGKSNSGKSQIGMQAALCGARNGGSSLFMDSEGAFRPERLDGIAALRGWEEPGLLDRVVYLRTDSAAEQMETIRAMPNRSATEKCRLVVVDTLTRNFSLDLPGRANMQSRQEALDVHLSEMARDAFINSRTYVLTNRVTYGAGDSEVGIGGRTVSQLVHDSIRLRKTDGTIRALNIQNDAESIIRVDSAGVH